jgi:DNA-binding CsgD family transcriptional regulator
MKKCYLVTLTETERAQLQSLCAEREVRQTTRRRAELLLRVDAGHSDRRIAQTLGVDRTTVERTRRRFYQAGSLAAYIAAGELPVALTVSERQAATTLRRRREVQALARRAKPLMEPGTQVRPGRGHKTPAARRPGTSDRQYLVNRIARDRPDILERMKRGEFVSVRAAAQAAGIVPTRTAECPPGAAEG